MAIRSEIRIQQVRQIAAEGIIKRGVFVNEAFAIANQQFLAEKQEMLQEFDNHDVTQEIQNGAVTDNQSDTLNIGRQEVGNLFSFFGFDGGSDPITPLREALDQNTRIVKTSRGARYNKDFIEYRFPVFAASVEGELAAAAPMPFGNAKSWILAVEGRGFSDINALVERYLYDSGKIFPSSRSGPAIQVEASLGNYSFSAKPYLTEIIKKFKNKFI